MHFAYPKREVWLSIYEYVSSAWAEIENDELPPPAPPCPHVWSMLSDKDKEDAWTLLLEWIKQHGIIEVNDLFDSDWCRSERHYIAEPESDRHAPYGRDPLLIMH